jgi:hypothetical protein
VEGIVVAFCEDVEGDCRFIAFAYAYEQATKHWRAPQFLPTADLGAAAFAPRLC